MVVNFYVNLCNLLAKKSNFAPVNCIIFIHLIKKRMATGHINKRVALFDLDGVVFDTETLYSQFWKDVFDRYHGNESGLERKIKGQTLVEIYDTYFADRLDVQQIITKALDEFERNMTFNYIEGFKPFILDLKNHGMKTAVVTSSNREKMSQVYLQYQDFNSLFDKVLTSECFEQSKPHPDPYLKGAAYFDADPSECIGFEDSFNGLKSVKAAEMTVIGLSTTNAREEIQSYCNLVIPDYIGLSYDKLMEMLQP